MGYVGGKYEEIRKNRKRMLRLMCAIRLQDRLTIAYLRNIWHSVYWRCEKQQVTLVGHLERTSDEAWVKKNLTCQVEGKRSASSTKADKDRSDKNDLTGLNANRVNAQNRTLWRRIIRGRGQRTWVTHLL